MKNLSATSDQNRRKTGRGGASGTPSGNQNNSVELDELSFYGKDNHLAPTIYLNDLYAEYEDGKTMPEIVDKIVSLYQNAVTTENFRAEDYLDFEKVKEHLACKLINRKKNEKLLREVPYQNFLNLAVVAYYKVEDEIHWQSDYSGSEKPL